MRFWLTLLSRVEITKSVCKNIARKWRYLMVSRARRRRVLGNIKEIDNWCIGKQDHIHYTYLCSNPSCIRNYLCWKQFWIWKSKVRFINVLPKSLNETSQILVMKPLVDYLLTSLCWVALHHIKLRLFWHKWYANNNDEHSVMIY